MSSTFQGLYIGLSGLRTQQAVQEMISHNISNANTTGYSRQDADVVSLPSTASGTAAVGSGVEVGAIRRSASLLLNRQIAEESAVLGQWQTLQSGTSEIEQVFQEPGSNGLQEAMTSFWAAWRSLSTDATSTSFRTNVVEAANTLATGFRNACSSVNDFISRKGDEIEANIKSVNTLSTQIATLNGQIMLASANGNPANDLRDQRDTAVEQLQGIVQVSTGENADGSLNVNAGGHVLVSRTSATAMELGLDAQKHAIAVWGDDHTAVAAGNSQMGALQDLRDWAQSDVLGGLNKVAAQIITSVNALHQNAYDGDGKQGDVFFTGTGAGDIAVSTKIAADSSLVAVAAGANSPADGSVAIQLAGLESATIPALNNDSIDGAYASLIGSISQNTQRAKQMATQEDQLLTFLDGRRQEIAGVSLDEEAVKMLGTQRAYQAAARVITTMDEMLDKLINDTGVVGR